MFVALESRRVLVSVDGVHFRCYNTMKAFGSFVTCCDFKSGVLFFGTDHGRVFAFGVRNPLNFLDLDLSKPSWQV